MPRESNEPLEPPLEILDLGDEGKLVTTITDWQTGTAHITPRATMEEKEIRVLRIHVPAEVKPTVPGYYDITATTLQAGLLGYLRADGWADLEFTITKHGVAPKARFTIEVGPTAGA